MVLGRHVLWGGSGEEVMRIAGRRGRMQDGFGERAAVGSSM